jgi:predicted DNA-binding helix-hairpin-helix protein
VKKPDTILDEVHAIRRKIEDQTKDMTRSERTAYFNRAGEEAARKYGFRRINRAKEKV